MLRRYFVLLTFFALTLTGCAFTEFMGLSADEPSRLFTVDYTGGLCVYGACGTNVTVYTDGTYSRSDGSGARIEGTFDQSTIDELTQLIAAADFNALRAT